MRVALVLFCLFCAARGFDLICEFTEGTLNGENVRICDTVNLTITKPNQTVTSVNGEIGRHFDVVEFLITNQTVNYFPKSVESFFPNLKRIRVYESKLKLLEQADLKPFTKLERFEAVVNELTKLYSNLFEYNPELRWIQLWDNELIFIGPNILNPLKKLQVANFESNVCSSFDAFGTEEIATAKVIIGAYCSNSDARQVAVQLKQEKVNKDLVSQKQKLSESHLAEMSKLFGSVVEGRELATVRYRPFRFKLTCWYNGSECLADKAVETDTDDAPTDGNVETLIIDKKPMIFIPSNIQRLFPNLTSLWFQNSAITMIDANDFANLTWLEQLYFDDNLIRRVPTEVFSNQPGLVIMHMKNNLIDTLEPRAFSGLPSLALLALSGNLLTTVNSNSFEGLQNLQWLYLNNNRLKFIDPKILTLSTVLNKINLEGNICTDAAVPENPLSEIKNEIITSCALPITINCKVSENENECDAKGLTTLSPQTEITGVNRSSENVTSLLIVDQSMKYFPKALGSLFPNLSELIVDNSSLLIILEQDFNGMSNLKMLTIRNNNMTTIGYNSFNGVTQLELLDLSSNSIKFFPSQIFTKLEKLRTLILSDNNLKHLDVRDFYVGQPLNAIETFKADGNALQSIEVGLIKYVRNATIIDLTGNVCINMRLDKQNSTGLVFADLVTQIILSCTS